MFRCGERQGWGECYSEQVAIARHISGAPVTRKAIEEAFAAQGSRTPAGFGAAVMSVALQNVLGQPEEGTGTRFSMVILDGDGGQVGQAIAEELARRETSDSLVAIDRDPVPAKYSEVVRKYYERLGNGDSASKAPSTVPR